MMLTKLYVQTATAHGRKNKNQDCMLYGTKILQENAAVDLEARGMLVDFDTFTTGEEGLLFAVADGISGGEAGGTGFERVMQAYETLCFGLEEHHIYGAGK